MDWDKDIDFNTEFDTEFGKAYVNKSGYCVVRLRRDTYVGLHRLMFEKYGGDIPRGYQIHHKDGDKTNNSIENLECLSRDKHMLLHEKWRRQRIEARRKKNGL